MAAEPPKYLSLRTIVSDWAETSGELPLLIIRRIGEWALMDAFESDAFVDLKGTVIPRIVIYRSCSAVADSSPYKNGPYDASIAAGALVTTTGVLAFCTRIDVELPKSAILSQPLVSSIPVPKPLHPAPPPCPGAATRAHRLEAEQWAVGLLNTMTTELFGEQVGRAGKAPEHLTAEFFQNSCKRWTNYATSAQGFITQCERPDLQTKLDGLLEKWDGLSQQAKIDAQNEARIEAAAESLRKEVALGRPKGSPLAKRTI